jgi:hypothetical protein
MIEAEKTKNEEKAKNKKVRRRLTFWQQSSILLGAVIVGLVLTFFVIPRLFSPSVEIVKFCEGVPCEEQGVMVKDGFTAMFDFLGNVAPLAFVMVGVGVAFAYLRARLDA